MNTADLWFRGDSFWPGALWRIPGLEIPRIEAEMRAAWDITTKFVNRWCRYNPERTYAHVEHTPPVRRRGGCGGLVPYKLAQYQPEVIGLIGTTTWTAECRCGGRETVEADPPRLNSRITDTIRRTWRLDRLFVHGTGRLPQQRRFFQEYEAWTAIELVAPNVAAMLPEPGLKRFVAARSMEVAQPENSAGGTRPEDALSEARYRSCGLLKSMTREQVREAKASEKAKLAAYLKQRAENKRSS